MKTYVICSVPAQIPYLGKFLFLRYGPECSQPIRLQDFLINHISRTNQSNSLIFLHVDTFFKLKVENFLVNMMKNVHDQSGYGTLKLTYLKNE